MCTYTKHPQVHPKHPFSFPELESGQNELPSGNLDPNWAKCLKSEQNLEVAKNKNSYKPAGILYLLILRVLGHKTETLLVDAQ